MEIKYSKIGKKYGRLTVLEVDISKYKKRRGYYYICRCDCGNIVSVRGNILGKNTNSCGCLKKEQDLKNLGRYTTGESHSKLACIWYHMKSRCDNPNDTNYPRYGKRGITVCQEWSEDFLKFKEWATNNGFKEGLTIDRINPDGNYEPENCRWLTLSEQQNNKRTTLWIYHNGKYKSLKQAYNEEKPPVTYTTVKERYHKGITDFKELFGPSRQHRGKKEN